jgi:hypothetical protein
MHAATIPFESGQVVTSPRDAALVVGYTKLLRRRHTTGVEKMDTPRDALAIAAFLGLQLDEWQRKVLASPHRRKLCLVSRQGGKGVVGTLTAIEKMLRDEQTKTVILTPTEDQSKRLLARIKQSYSRLPVAPKIVTDIGREFVLENGSRVIAMPGSETSIRGIDAVHQLIVDEAAFVPDELYAVVRPFMATTNGAELDLSTAHGKRGWFYQAYTRAITPPVPGHMLAVRVTADQIPRISPEFLANELSELGQFVYDQEYNVVFLDDETQVFSSDLIAAAKSPAVMSLGLRRLGEAA